MAAITYRNASCIYEGSDKLAVDSLNLDISDGEFVVLVGPSGSGKSTALRMLAGLEDIDEGSIEIGGKDMVGVPSKDRDIAMAVIWALDTIAMDTVSPPEEVSEPAPAQPLTLMVSAAATRAALSLFIGVPFVGRYGYALTVDGYRGSPRLPGWGRVYRSAGSRWLRKQRDLDGFGCVADQVESFLEFGERELVGADAIHGKCAGFEHGDGSRPAVGAQVGTAHVEFLVVADHAPVDCHF